MPAATPKPSHFPTTLTQIASLEVRELARNFGTPVYVYDAAKIEERISDLAHFDVVRFAQKACSNLAVLDLVRRHGAVVDTVSAGEIHRALAAGFLPGPADVPQIVYTADIFDRQSLDLVAEHDIPINCGSPDMIDQYGERRHLSRNSSGEITLRINPGFGHGHSQKTNTGGQQSKHGIWHTQLEECLARARRYDLAVTGVHMHIGSGADLEHLSQVCAASYEAASTVGRSVQMISAGGGLPVAYREGNETIDVAAYFELWDETRRRLANDFGHAVRLEIEPGRYLVAESGHLIAEIRAIKQMGGNLFYLLDAGFNNLARPVLYGAYHPMAICPVDRALETGVKGQGEEASGRIDLRDVVVGGPLCESGDIFTQQEGGFVGSRKLPAAEVGDFLVIGCAGAYGQVMASNYNSKLLAPEVLIENGKAHLVRQRQTLDDLIRGETIPQR